jgi:hypothetical protein
MPGTDNVYTCPSCGNNIAAKFCGYCGEKKVDHHDFSMKHLAEESIEGLTHFDNKFFRSLKLLITKPGLLSKYHFEGKRVPYMKPLQLFIVCNVIFFFLLGKQNVFSLNFYNYKNFTPYTHMGTEAAIAAKATGKISVDDLGIRFNTMMSSQSKTFLIIFIPFIAIWLALFFINKRKYFAEHLVFATHYFTFLMLYYIASRYLVELPFSWFSKDNYNSTFDLITTFVSLLILSVYFAKAAKRFYATSTLQTVLSGIYIALVFTLGIYAYRMFLFYKILYGI